MKRTDSDLTKLQPQKTATNDERAALGLFFELIGEIICGHWSPAVLQSIQRVPELKTAYQKWYGNQVIWSPETGADPLEDLQVDHFQVFGREIFPYAGQYLGDEHPFVLSLQEWEMPYESEFRRDHFGVILVHWGQVKRSRTFNQDLDRSLGSCLELALPPFLLALEHQSEGFYADLATLLRRVLLEITNVGTPPQVEAPHPSPTLDAQHPDLSIKKISKCLASPEVTGVFFNHRRVSQIAKCNDLPDSFGGRINRLDALFQAAADYERIPDLLETMIGICDATKNHLQRDWQSRPERGRPWIEKVERSAHWLASLRDQAVQQQSKKNLSE